MIKIMIVDDEENIRLGISEVIPWADFGMEVVGQAANGVEALRLAEQHRPDIVLLDINMPVMDGLAFSHKVKAVLPDLTIIVLTGYDEFEYAKESIKLGVSDYLLKPISPPDLIAAVNKARDQVLQRVETEHFINAIKLQLKQSLPLLREKLVYDILHGNYLEPNKMGYLDFPSDKFAALVMEPEECIPAASGDDTEQLTLMAVKKIVDDTINQHAWGLSIANDGILETLVCLPPQKTDMNDCMNALAESARSNIEECLQIQASIGIGNLYTGVQQVNCSLAEAYKAITYKSAAGRGRLYDISLFNMRSPLFVEYPFDKEISLINQLKIGSNVALSIFDELISELENTEDSAEVLTYAKVICRELLNTILKYFTSTGSPFAEINGAYDALCSRIPDYDNLDGLKIEVRGFIRSCLRIVNESIRQPYRKEINWVSQYIAQHYHEDISLKELSSLIYMNANYLCKIFKEEFGETINQYMIRIRMEKSKELLLTTDLKIFEIAEQVGYSNNNYFSYAFKKYTNMSPNAFRDSNEESP